MNQVSTRFSVAVHIMALLDVLDGKMCTSELIGKSVNTNPVVIRRTLARLKRAGLVETHAGVPGAYLSRGAEKILLLEIFRAVSSVAIFDLHNETNGQCPVGSTIQEAMADTVYAAHLAFEEELGSRTLKDIVDRIKEINSRKKEVKL